MKRADLGVESEKKDSNSYGVLIGRARIHRKGPYLAEKADEKIEEIKTRETGKTNTTTPALKN